MQGLACFLHLVPCNKDCITLHLKRRVWDVAAGVVLTVTVTHGATEISPASKSLHSNWKLEKLLDKYTSQVRNKKGSATGRWHTVCTPSTPWVMPPPWSRDTSHLLISSQRDIDDRWHPLKVLVKKKMSLWCDFLNKYLVYFKCLKPRLEMVIKTSVLEIGLQRACL